MDKADSDLVRSLLAERKVVALALLVDGKPYVGQLPFAIRGDFSSLLIHASQLARHSRGLVDGAPFSALIQAPDGLVDDPFQAPRLMIQGAVQLLPAGSNAYEDGREVYLGKLPSGSVTFSLGDFRLYDLVIEKARLVSGFGRTANLTPGALAEIASRRSPVVAEPETGAEEAS